jgi:transcriptional regulator with XRE-family HTH domain
MERQVDKDWFFDQLERQRKSLRGLARHMELDPSAVSRILSGKRRMQMEEAAAIARFLGAPVSEVLSHAGLAVDLDGQPTRIILAAIISADGRVERLREPRPLPQSVIDKAQAAIRYHRDNGQVIAAQIRAAEGPLALWDDAVVLFGYSERVEPSAIGALSVCRLIEGDQLLAKIDRARKTGEARVLDVSNAMREVVLDTATPVLAIIP